jgi:hypothetical protein
MLDFTPEGRDAACVQDAAASRPVTLFFIKSENYDINLD